MSPFLLFLGGLLLLVAGGEMLIRGAARFALILKISPLVVGLTVVAYGTSTPELSVNLLSVLQGKTNLALGNIVGSNICNVFLILGISALIRPLVVHQQIIRFDVPLMIGASVLLWVLGLDGNLGRLDGVLLVAGVIAYTVFVIRISRRESDAVREEYDAELASLRFSRFRSFTLSVAMLAAGLGLLILGSRWMVSAAVVTAKSWGVNELIIGLTIVAVGTSLPEILTSILAALRGKVDIAVGNVVGSNIYNLLAILGLSALLAKDGVPVPESALRFDIPVMIGAAVCCLPIFISGHKISRWEGGFFFAYFLAYILFLTLDAAEHDALAHYQAVMLSFFLPLTVVTLLVLMLREMKATGD